MMSRTIGAAVLGLVLAVACGCGSKPEPTQSAPAEPAPTKEPDAAPKSDAPKSEPPKADVPAVAWELDPDKHTVPATPVRGRIAGADVTPAAVAAGDELTFRVAKPGEPAERAVTIKFGPGAQPGQARGLKVKPSDTPGPNVPQVWLDVKGKATLLHPSGYGLTLEMGARKDGKVNGKIYLAVPDPDQSVLAGTFAAEYFRLSTEKPGPDDAPYVAGDITVAGAAPDAKVRVAYAAFAATGAVSFAETQLPLAAQPVAYEHTKLEPGRYLISVAVGDGPLAWKWVDLPAGGGATENFALDPGKTGALEVSAAPGAAGKVFLAPADDPARPPLEAKLFEVLSAQTVRGDIALVAGKAVVKNLGPGRYEVRFGDERRVVEVAAGKTAEVNLAPAKK